MIDINRIGDQVFASPSSQKLIDGSLMGPEAREIMISLLDSAIDFHKLQNLRSQTRTNAPNPDSQRVLKELQATRSQLCETLAKGNGQDAQFRLRCTIDLESDRPIGSR